MTQTSSTQPAAATHSNDSSLGIVSLVLGLVSLTGPGLLFGIPAIILGAIALKRKQGERGLSITGIVTGAVSTFLSLVIIGFIVFVLILSAAYPQEGDRNNSQQMQQQERDRFESSST
jgi:O-antigen/teichoic acid export membrane protein